MILYQQQVMAKDNSHSEDLVLEAARLEELLSNALELGAGASGRTLLVRRAESEAVLKVVILESTPTSSRRNSRS